MTLIETAMRKKVPKANFLLQFLLQLFLSYRHATFVPVRCQIQLQSVLSNLGGIISNDNLIYYLTLQFSGLSILILAAFPPLVIIFR